MESDNKSISTNLAYQDYNILQLRLDTQKLHKDILNFLSGKTQILVYNNELNQYVETDLTTGEPLANKKGIQNILSFVVSVANSHTVQGNIDKDEYYKTLYFINLHLGQQLTINCENWGIDKKNRRHILNTIMVMLQMFFSRTIDNLERQALTPMVQKERTIYQESKKGII